MIIKKVKRIRILFLLAKSSLNKAGKCPVRCRFTYDKQRHEFSTGLFIDADNWYSKEQRAKPPNEENEFLNTQLSLIKNKINQAFLLLQMEGEQYEFEQGRLEQVRDLFVFCCYTGLAYTEMANLKAEHIIDGFDGMKWIKMMRQKTKSMIAVPLLPRALEMLDKYRTEESVLPAISNQKFNSYMREITAIVGINKRVTHHVARKTFATTVLLYNDVPMEIVSQLLGHSKMAMTQQHYGKIVQKSVSEKMIELRKKLK